MVYKKKKIKKKYSCVGNKFTYIGRTRDTGSRIVLYDGKILSHDKDSGIVTVSYIDRSITYNPNRDIVDRELPLSALNLN